MYSPLPLGTHPRALSFPHFPALHQAVIFRNWGIVPGKTIAQVLCAAESQIHHAAAEMGLPCDVGNSEIWLRRGYLTVIRNNWHLLPYDQLLALLGWNTDRLNAVLQEEDFLWHKLGYLKPDCPKVFFRELKEEEKIQTAEISRILHEYFPDQDTASDEKPFSFIDALSAPYTSLKTHTDTTQCRFEWRLIHSYFGCTGDVLHNLKENDPYPEGLLARYAELGVNAVWLHAVLYRLYPWKPAGDLSKDYQSRFDNLNTLIERAQRHGISLFLYLNEPRALPADCFDAHPTLRGVNSVDGLTSALCTSQPENLQFLHEASAWVFRQSPGLAGVFTISMSENLTHCHSRGRGAECPRCAQRPVSTVIAEVNNTIAAGIRSIKKMLKYLFGIGAGGLYIRIRSHCRRIQSMVYSPISFYAQQARRPCRCIKAGLILMSLIIPFLRSVLLHIPVTSGKPPKTGICRLWLKYSSTTPGNVLPYRIYLCRS